MAGVTIQKYMQLHPLKEFWESGRWILACLISVILVPNTQQKIKWINTKWNVWWITNYHLHYHISLSTGLWYLEQNSWCCGSAINLYAYWKGHFSSDPMGWVPISYWSITDTHLETIIWFCFIGNDLNFHILRLLPNMSQTAANRNSQICSKRPHHKRLA